MKLLVTGATGFVGYHFVKKALASGHEITCPVRPSSSTNTLQNLNVQLCIAEHSDKQALKNCFSTYKPNVVVHCAGCVVAATEQQFIEANVEFTQNICQASLEHNVERLVYISTVDVNSANPTLPITEDLPYIATTTYGKTKIDAEKIVLQFREQGLKSVILRPTTIIGEDEPHGMKQLLPLVMKRRIPLPGLKNLKDQIHLVYIGNLVQAMELALTKEQALQQTFNICDENTTSIRAMLKIMVEELQCKAPRVMPSWLVNIFLLLPPLKKSFNSIFKDWAYDISRAKQLLGYKPDVSTEEAMRRTVRRWKENENKKT